MKIAIQGLKGSYTELAAIQICNSADDEFMYLDTFDEVFSAISREDADRGVVAFSNSRLGAIRRPAEILTGHSTMNDYWIDGGITIPVNHCLAVNPGAVFENVKEIITQPEAFNQCNNFIYKLDASIKLTEGRDTALSAKIVSKSNRLDFATICSEKAAKIYNLVIAFKSIQDDELNFTRFVSFTKNENKSLKDMAPDNTIATITLQQHKGSLERALHVFTEADIDIRTIHSRNIPNTNLEVDMVTEFRAGVNNPIFKKIVKKLAKDGAFLTIIGSYKESKSNQVHNNESKKVNKHTINAKEEVRKFEELIKKLKLN